jgi:hypothetical protein
LIRIRIILVEGAAGVGNNAAGGANI